MEVEESWANGEEVGEVSKMFNQNDSAILL